MPEVLGEDLFGESGGVLDDDFSLVLVPGDDLAVGLCKRWEYRHHVCELKDELPGLFLVLIHLKINKIKL